VLAQVIDDRPNFDPDVWIRRLPALGLFGALVFQVIGQQISVIAATAIFARLIERFGGRVPDAGELASVDQGTLRGLGLSRRKAATVLDLAQRFNDGRLSDAELRELPDQEVIRRLTEVKGIGAWTVQGALLIALQRPDVIRPDDLALRHAIQARYGLDHLPSPAEVADLARRWRPYRSSPPACCWPPRDRADSAERRLPASLRCPAVWAVESLPVLRPRPSSPHHNDQDWINASKSGLQITRHWGTSSG
jgi:DNA-3-methyladenine glycosylase II